MERWQNCVAVVTGAGGGIGSVIARDLVTAGFRVVAIDIRVAGLKGDHSKLPEELQKCYFPRLCDVSNEVDVNATFGWIEENLGGTDVLVNNAGIVRPGNLLEMDPTLIDDVLNTNVKGVIYCTQAAFRSMKKRNFDGHIVFINSIAGHHVVSPVPDTSMNIYSPSKFAVTAINETIRNELRILGTKIKTTSISPGAVRTEIAPETFWETMTVYLKPENISQAVVFAISTPPDVQIHEITVKPVGETV